MLSRKRQTRGSSFGVRMALDRHSGKVGERLLAPLCGQHAVAPIAPQHLGYFHVNEMRGMQ